MTTQNNQELNFSNVPPEILNAMMENKKIRTAVAMQSHAAFFNFYLPQYVTYPTADFQKEFFRLTEEENFNKVFIVAFRGSSKSSIFTTSYPLWAILGKPKKKFVLILCQTMSQAKPQMMNIRRQLENNKLLKDDLGPFQEESTEWGSYSLVFSNLNARITVASSEQSIRGLRHNETRPDLIIADDLEDLASVKTREGRQKMYQWFTGEVIPIGDRNTKIVVVGNLLHEDSLLMRLKRDLAENKIDGIFREYPLVDKRGNILWPGKYPTQKDIEEEMRKVGNDIAFRREFLLEIVPDEEQVIRPDWIQYYNELPKRERDKFIEIRIGIDLAISKSDSANYTAIIPAIVASGDYNNTIYILPDAINERLDFPETTDVCKRLNKYYMHQGSIYPLFLIEDVGYQKAMIQHLHNEGIFRVKGVRPGMQDKRSRLMMTSHMVKHGRVLFPRNGGETIEKLIGQIVHFGVEKYDDLADAFSTLVNSVIQNPPMIPCEWMHESD